MNQKKKLPLSISLVVLLVVNIVPLIGVIALGWSPMEILSIYWMETLIIGFFNVFKMILAAPKDMSNNILKVIMVPFFIVHFGVFLIVQGVFILLGIPTALEGDNSEEAISLIIDDIFAAMWWPALLLFSSHLFSFFWNYMGKEEYKKEHVADLMFKPYTRVFVQQFIAIFGVIVAEATSSVILIVVLVIIFKTAADAFAHRREHKKLEEQQA